MPTTTINGLPSPDDSSPNRPPIHFDALNGVLDTRIVARFATTAARNSAITAPVAGMVSYTADDKRLWLHDGTGWQYLGGAPPATITFPGAAGFGFVGGVSNYAAPKLYKDGAGLVHGLGALQRSGAPITNPVIGTLPVGYRPLTVQTMAFSVTQAGSLATYQVEVGTSGDITALGTVPNAAVFFLTDLLVNPAA